MGTAICVFVWLFILESHACVAENNLLRVSVLLEKTRHGMSTYFAFLSDITRYAFTEIENRTDILPEYSLELETKDTQVK